jgi:hypothetical protein
MCNPNQCLMIDEYQPACPMQSISYVSVFLLVNRELNFDAQATNSQAHCLSLS